MNLLKTLVITAALIISCNYLSAQKHDDTAGIEKKWCIKDAFIVNETQSLAIYEHKKDESGVALDNNKGTIEWEMPFDGCVMAISKYKDHYLVFYTGKGYWSKVRGSTKTIKQINAATVDIKSQKIIEDKVIYTGSKFVAPDFQNDPAGNFSQLLLRHTLYGGYNDIKGYTLITLNTDGSVTNKEIASTAIDGKFIGSSPGKDGCFFISSIQNWSSIVVEKFSHEGALISKLETPLSIRKDPDYDPFMRTDTYTQNGVAVAVKLVNPDNDYAFSYFGFNFDNNQVAVVNEAPLTKKTSPYHFDYFRDLKPVDIFFTTDNVIVVRTPLNWESIITGNTSKVIFNSGCPVVSVFNKQMKLQREIIINKATRSSNYKDLLISCQLNKDKLYILSGETLNIPKFDNICYTVNLNEGTYEKKKIGTHKASATTSLSTSSTIWFKNECIITHLHIGFAGSAGTFRSVLERVGFDTL